MRARFLHAARAMVRRPRAPLAYLEHAFFEHACRAMLIVWANRGGGKTQLGAIATLLDMLFKPGIQIRILGGSFEQSIQDVRYLRRCSKTISSAIWSRQPHRPPVELINGSRVEVLSQSERAVRGQRVHKLRCDEVELFDEHVWEAAQMVTRSGQCGETFVPGAIETLSTMHEPVRHDAAARAANTTNTTINHKRRIMRWSVLDVLERCPPERDCGSRARSGTTAAAGPSAPAALCSIDDAIQQRGASARRHGGPRCSASSRTAPLRSILNSIAGRTSPRSMRRAANEATWLGGIDFGFAIRPSSSGRFSRARRAAHR
jgi:hypothetical protein